jgi:hypothetical protein
MTGKPVDRLLIPKKIASQIDILWNLTNSTEGDWKDSSLVSDEKLTKFLNQHYNKSQVGGRNHLNSLLTDIDQNKIIIDLNDAAVITSRFSVLNELYRIYVEDESEEMLQTIS